jgi:hypothetical protein
MRKGMACFAMEVLRDAMRSVMSIVLGAQALLEDVAEVVVEQAQAVEGALRRRSPDKLGCDLGLYGPYINGVVPNPNPGCNTFGDVGFFKNSETFQKLSYDGEVDTSTPEFSLIRRLRDLGMAGIRLDLGGEFHTRYTRALQDAFDAEAPACWIIEYYGRASNTPFGLIRESFRQSHTFLYDEQFRRNLVNTWGKISGGQNVLAEDLFQDTIANASPRLSYVWLDNHNIEVERRDGTKFTDLFPGNRSGEPVDALLFGYTVALCCPGLTSIWAWHDPSIKRAAPLSLAYFQEESLRRAIRSSYSSQEAEALRSTFRACLRLRPFFDTRGNVTLEEGWFRPGVFEFKHPIDGSARFRVYVGRITREVIAEIRQKHSNLAFLDERLHTFYDTWQRPPDPEAGYAPVLVMLEEAPEVPDATMTLGDAPLARRLGGAWPVLEAYWQFEWLGDDDEASLLDVLVANDDHLQSQYSCVWLPPCQAQSIQKSRGFAPAYPFAVAPYWAYAKGDGASRLKQFEEYVLGLRLKGRMGAIVDTTIRKVHTG